MANDKKYFHWQDIRAIIWYAVLAVNRPCVPLEILACVRRFCCRSCL